MFVLYMKGVFQVKEEILKDLTEGEIEFLKILSYRLNNQDQRCTAYPIWKVCDVERKYGVSDAIADGYCIFNTETDEVYLDCKQIIDKIIVEENYRLDTNFNDIHEILKEHNVENDFDLNSLYSIFEFIIKVLEWKHYSYCGYTEEVNVCATFITEKEAESFMECNKYKYSDDAYIYVDSAYGNLEMMMLIDILKKLKI